MKLNAIFRKELRVNSRSYRTMVATLILNSIFALIGLVTLILMTVDANLNGNIDYENMITLYIALAICEFILFSIIAPGLTSNSISGERERQTLDILLTTKMSAFQIVRGKMYAAAVDVIMMSVSLLPVLSLVFIFGGVTLFDLLKLTLFLIVTSMYIGSLGILFSTVIKKTISATVLTYVSALILYFAPFGVVSAILSYINQDYYMGYSDVMQDIGYGICILLITPVTTLVDVLCKQVGADGYLLEIFTELTGVEKSNFLIKHWDIASMLAQIVLAILFLFIASLVLNPVKKVKVRKKNESVAVYAQKESEESKDDADSEKVEEVNSAPVQSEEVEIVSEETEEISETADDKNGDDVSEE